MKQVVLQFMRGVNDGGAETLVKDYTLLLNKDKFKIYVVVLFDKLETANSQIMHSNMIKIISIYRKWNFATRIWNKLFGEIYVGNKIKGIIKKSDAKVIHAHLGVLKYLKVISGSLKKIKLFYTCHSLPDKFFGAYRRKEFQAAQYLIAHNNLRLIALHDEMATELNDLFGINNTVVIRNGVDFNKFKRVGWTKNEMREKLSIPKDAFVIGHVGRFHSVKNHEFLIDVFRETLKLNSKAFLFMIGNGELLEHITNKILLYKIENQVLILSHRSDVPELMKAMDIFVFPSLYEGFGIVLIEAQISGLRCIASKSVPKAAFVTDLALRMDIDDSPKKWAEVILDKDNRAIAKGDISLYDMNRVIRKLESLYLYGEDYISVREQ